MVDRIVHRLSTPVAVVVAIALMALIWMVAMPPSAGPDEPSHIVRGAALVRGMLEGETLEADTVIYYFELPADIAFPAPNCYAFQPDVPASCATSVEVPSGEGILFTKSTDYPIWGHLLPGVGTLVPGEAGNMLARLLDSLVPILLIGASTVVAARRGALVGGALLLALTPMVWFTVAVVNPSGYVIAGGVGLWTALLTLSGEPPDRPVSARTATWLGAVSWAAMVLPRRDGLVYAALVLSIVILFAQPDLRRIGRGPLVVVGGSTLATLAWAFASDTTSSKALFVAPLAPVAAVGFRRVWRPDALRTRSARIGAGVGLAVVGLLGLLVVMDRRADGFDRAALRAAISRSGTNLRQAVGDLGWLDTPVPESSVFLWLLALGMLAGVALLEGSRRLLAAAATVVGIGVVAAWTLTMLQNDPTGTYWQGRYYLPLLVGAPILLGAVRLDHARARRLGLAVGGVGMVVVNIALAQAMRRFGVGTTGSLSPFDWHTYDALVPPAVLLVLHVVVSAALVLAVIGLADRSARPSPGVNVVGYHHVTSGVGRIAREVHASLVAAGVPCTVVDVVATDSPQRREPQPANGPIHDTTVAVVPALQLPTAIHDLPDLAATHDRLVGYFFWELDVVPDEHLPAISMVDEIWAPTEFVRGAYAGADGDTPVRLAPTRIESPVVDDDAVARWRAVFLGASTPSSPGVPAEDAPFVFLTSLDLFSVIERKNPRGTIDAFRAAFDASTAGGTDVRLVVKTINGDQRPDDLASIVAAADADPRITVIDEYVDDADLHAMIAAADCFVSLHRSEGLGLHLADAMWLGTPVIATRWSGNLDLMDDDSAALVDAELVGVSDGRGAYPETARWAAPDIDQAASFMRRLVAEPMTAQQLAGAARARMEGQPERAEIGRSLAAALGLDVPSDAVDSQLGAEDRRDESRAVSTARIP